jgi:hypothetical protein
MTTVVLALLDADHVACGIPDGCVPDPPELIGGL